MATRTPTAVIDLEISNPVPPARLAARHDRAQVLVRLHDRPLGFVTGRLRGGRLDFDALTRDILESHAAGLAAPLVDRALAIGCVPKWPEVEPLLACRPGPVACTPSVAVAVRASGSGDGRLRACLDAVQAQDYPAVDVLVLDGAADDRALAQAGGDLLVVVDEAVVLERGWLRAVVRVLLSDPEVMAVAGLTLPRETAVTLPATVLQRRWHRGGHVEVRPAPGAPAAVAFWRAGLERLSLEHVLASGASVVYEPSALGWHASRMAADPCVDGGAVVSRLGVRRVDLAETPRSIADATAEDALRLEVAWGDRILGALDLLHHGAIVSPFRIQDAVSRELAWAVLDTQLRVGEEALRAILTSELAKHLLVARAACACALPADAGSHRSAGAQGSRASGIAA